MSQRRNIDHEFYELVTNPATPPREAIKRGSKMIRRRNEVNRGFMWWMAEAMRRERETADMLNRWADDGGY